jgi:ketosteroid isomerase-like protein
VDNMRVATSLFDAVEASDLDAIRALCTDDFAIWHNTGSPERTLDGLVADLTGLLAVARDLAYIDRRYLATEDGVWAQHVLTGETLGGVRFALPAAVRLIINAENRIARIEEYMDSAASAVLAEEYARCEESSVAGT